MKHWPIYDLVPEYLNLRKQQDPVSGEDFSPTIFKNVLSQDELNLTKKIFNEYPLDKIDVQSYSGLGTLHIQLLNYRDSIIKKIEKMASDAVGEDIEVLEFGGTRYSPKFGWETKLGPHYDTRPVEMFVFDLQVQSNQQWGLFFEGERIDLEDNVAVLFNGTGQIHWRDSIRLNDNAEIDLIFFWMQHKKPKPITEKHTKIMKDRQAILLKTVPIMKPLDNSQWWKPVKIENSISQYRHYEKISTDNHNPLFHNEIYNVALNTLDYNVNFDIKDTDISTVSLSSTKLSEIVERMKHIHAEFTFILSKCYLVKSIKSNKDFKNFIKNNFNNNKILTMAINIGESPQNLYIDDRAFAIDRFSAITFSPTHQTIKIKDNGVSNLLLCNFVLIDEMNKAR